MTEATLVGKILADRYEIDHEIGRGALGVVYKGRHRALGRAVAVKVLFEDLQADENSFERFKLEAKSAASLNHPNIVSVFDFGLADNGSPYLVMDFLDGQTLQAVINREKRVQLARAIPFFIQICDAMAQAHSLGIIHRDLKPDNIILLKQGRDEVVKVVDFGIAKRFNNKEDTSAKRLTVEGQVVGTPAFMSPEQIMGVKRLDARSDIYSFGCLMYVTLAGVLPICGANSVETMSRHISVDPLPLSHACPGALLPEAIQQIVMKTLKKFPEDRYQSMMHLKTDLEHFAKCQR